MKGAACLRLAAVLLPAALGLPAAAEGLVLGKGTDAKSKTEAAELSYLNDAAKGSSIAIAAALMWSPPAGYSPGSGTLQWDIGAGVNKNTTAGDKRVDKQLLAFGARHVLDLDADDRLLTRAALERRRNRLSDGDESAFSAIAAFNLRHLKVFGPGFQAKGFPFLGIYRTSTRGNTGAQALNGSYGGTVAGFDVAVDLASGTTRWAVVDVSLRRQFEQQTSGDFRSARYDLGSVDLKFPLAVTGGEGAVSLGHGRGTDRIGGTPWKRQTLLKLSLKWGSA